MKPILKKGEKRWLLNQIIQVIQISRIFLRYFADFKFYIFFKNQFFSAVLI
jgi:hypothetical protein